MSKKEASWLQGIEKRLGELRLENRSPSQYVEHPFAEDLEPDSLEPARPDQEFIDPVQAKFTVSSVGKGK